MAGFGSLSFGGGPYGLGTPATAPVPGGLPLTDVQNGEVTGSRRLHTSSRDYVFDSFGRIEGMGDVRQLMQLAFLTDRGSSALPTLGHDLRKIDRITDSTRKRIQTAVEVAIEPLVLRGLVQLVAVEIKRVHPSGVSLKVRWRDLGAGIEQETIL